MKLQLVILLLVYFFHVTSALNCYTCTVTETDIDQSCIDDPNRTTNCNKKYCTARRQEYLDPKDKVASMYRGCEDDPMYMNVVMEDETYRVYYSACDTPLCNGGSGKSSDDSSGALGDKSTIYCPGTAKGNSLFTISFSVAALVFINTLIKFL